ncbi:hypothetical protein U1Q18_036780 [Sarracenia purpurea var. burkii]
MEQGGVGGAYRISSGRFLSYERIVAIGLGLLAVVSPLYVDRRSMAVGMEAELEEQQGMMIINAKYVSWCLPLMVLLGLMVAITLSRYLDQSFSRFDPSWIHRLGGSSLGILIILLLLALILKCKASTSTYYT